MAQRLPIRDIAAQAAKVKRALRQQGWIFEPLGLEPTGVYANHRVIAPNGSVHGEMNSKSIIILAAEGYFERR